MRARVHFHMPFLRRQCQYRLLKIRSGNILLLFFEHFCCLVSMFLVSCFAGYHRQRVLVNIQWRIVFKIYNFVIQNFQVPSILIRVCVRFSYCLITIAELLMFSDRLFVNYLEIILLSHQGIEGAYLSRCFVPS